jgi:hypothetical protein
MKNGFLYLKLLLIVTIAAGVLLFISGIVFQLHHKTDQLLTRYRMHNELMAVMQMLQLELKSSPGIIDTASNPTTSQQLSFWNADHQVRVLTVKNQRLVLQGNGTTYLTSSEWVISNFIISPLPQNVYRISFIVPWQKHNYYFQRSFRLLYAS